MASLTDDSISVDLPSPPTVLVNAETLDVHVVSHSHDDYGWRYTPADLYEHYVAHIFENTIDALNANPELTFLQVEVAFFEMWWARSNRTRKEAWKK